MPGRLNQSDRKIVYIAAAVFLALVVIGVFVTSPEVRESGVPSSHSASSFGAKAAFLLLRETGWRTERWEQSLTKMEGGKNKVVIIAEPDKPANKQERAALHAFIRRGGRLIAVGQSAGSLLPEKSSIRACVEKPAPDNYPALVPTSITRDAPQIEMDAAACWFSEASAIALYGDALNKVVVTYPYGEGSVIWWADALPLTNAGLKAPGNLEFFLACLGDKSKNQIYWDEYLHGYSQSPVYLLEYRALVIVLAQLAFLAVAVLLTFARRSGPVRNSAPEIRLSPLEFVETLGGLYERARAAAIAVDICYQRFLYWLTKRLALSSAASIEDLAQAVADRWNFKDERFVSTLKECASVRYKHLSDKSALQLVRSLHSYAMKLNLFKTSKEK
jgi:hypothetical protein